MRTRPRRDGTARTPGQKHNWDRDPLPYSGADHGSIPVGELDAIVQANRPARVPVGLSREELPRSLDGLSGRTRLVGTLLCGSGLRLLEALTLRIEVVDLARLTIRCGKRARVRAGLLPVLMAGALQRQAGLVAHQTCDGIA